MGLRGVLESTQTQGTAAYIAFLNQLRLDELLAKLAAQDHNLEQALQTLYETKQTIAEQIIAANRGGTKGMHGFIAEMTEVGIGNARKLLDGAKPEYLWINDNGPADILRKSVELQQKFVRTGGHFSLEAIKEHLTKYPDFLKNGGKYQIPKDFHEQLQVLLSMPENETKKLAGSTGADSLSYGKWKWVQDFFQNNPEIKPDDIEASCVNYRDVQRGTIDRTLKNEENSLKDITQERREQAYQESRPTVTEGVKVTAVSAALEGGMKFCLGVAKKLKEGKTLHTFTAEDWKEVGLDTAQGTAGGAVRGTSVYLMTNFSATPAAVANALVTAAFGVAAQANQLRQGMLSEEDFLVNAQVLVLDASVSALTSIMGQAMIPVPVLGAMIGNTAGVVLYELAKRNLSEREQRLIAEFQTSTSRLNQYLDIQYQMLIEELQQEFARYTSIIELAFDPDVNTAFAGSIQLADYAGVDETKVLRTKQDIDHFFL